jgi:biotin transport system ATP-binding protein
MITLKNVSLVMAEHTILENIDLSINERRVGLIGANGSGKSTLARLIKGLIHPTHGKITVLGTEIKINQKHCVAKVGFVFQDPDNQIILPVVEDDIAFGLKNQGLSKSQIKNKVEQVLSCYNLEKISRKTTYNLSGGEKQLLAIAGVLAMEPELVIFDEPTTLLDLRNKNLISKLINELSVPVIMATHDLDLLNNFDRVIMLDNGKIAMDDVPATVLNYYVKTMS